VSRKRKKKQPRDEEWALPPAAGPPSDAVVGLELVRGLRGGGDAAMVAGRHAEADEAYAAAWSTLVETPRGLDDYGLEAAFWLLVSRMDALYRRGELAQAYDAGARIERAFAGHAVGNPFFHLRVGQLLFALDGDAIHAGDGRGSCADHLARALICGGIDLFAGEDPKYLGFILPRLKPPKGYASWEATSRRQGGDAAVSRARLDGAPAYLHTELGRKFGDPPPYVGRAAAGDHRAVGVGGDR
jgi:hypothetical protein